MTAERLMVAFAGTAVPAEVGAGARRRAVRRRDALPRPQRALTCAGARADGFAPGCGPAAARPLLIAADQEGGQLNALGEGPTAFAGAMALGAAGDPGLAERVARATAIELRALGVNVNYAPVCDLATAPDNPALGIRSSATRPPRSGSWPRAYVRGLQGEGVAATVKHFPGHGEATSDTHHGLAVVAESRDELQARELVPFRRRSRRARGW